MPNRLLLVLLVILYPCIASAQAPVIEKVEPPNWWVGMKWHQVQLMVYGDQLDGISARFEDPRITIKAIHTLENSSYAFLDIEIPDTLSPGAYTITFTRNGESTSIDYPIWERADDKAAHKGFGLEDVVYLITPDRFANGDPDNDSVEGIMDEYNPSSAGMRHGGDLQGIIDHLPYLQDLGVTALWLNPILENNGRNSYHGYKTTNLYRIDPRFGENADYKRFVDEAHQHGLKVIFDHVNNHIGIRHEWMSNLPMESWVNGSVEDHLSQKHYKMAITDVHGDPSSDELLRTFWFVDSMPDLDQRNPYVATYRIQNTLWWIEYSGIDGIREDTYPYSDQEFLADWAEAILDEYPHFNIVGEIWETKPAYLSLFQKESLLPRTFETNLPAIMDFPLADAFRSYLEGQGSLDAIYKVITQDLVYTDLDNIMTLFDNHDMARGTYIAEGDTRKVKQVLAMLLTMRGIPQLLYGTEINMKGGASHIELRADFPGGFPGDTRSAFTKEGRTDEENDMFDFTRSLLHLRKKHPALATGKMIHYPTPGFQTDIYKYMRMDDNEIILVLVNGHDETMEVDLSEVQHWFGEADEMEELMTGEAVNIKEGMSVEVVPRGVRLFRIER